MESKDSNNPGLSRRCGRFRFVKGVPGEMRGERRGREEYWPRKNGSGPVSAAAQGVGEKKFGRPGVTFHWSACPVSNPFCSAPPLPSAIIGRNKLNRFFLGRPLFSARFPSSFEFDFGHPRHVGGCNYQFPLARDQGGVGENVFTSEIGFFACFENIGEVI